MNEWLYKITVTHAQSNNDDIVISNFTEETDNNKTISNVVKIGYLTVSGTLSRTILSDSNQCILSIFNLARGTRDKIFQDPFINYNDPNAKYLKLEVGYGDIIPLSLVFYGRIFQAYSRHAGGSQDIETVIEARFNELDCYTATTFIQGSSRLEAYKAIANQAGFQLGSIGGIEGNFETDTTFEGNAIEQLNKISGDNTYVDNNVVHTLFNNQVLFVDTPLLKYDDFLLETPMRREMQIEVRSIMLPFLLIGQKLQINSNLYPNYNGDYKVIGVNHSFTFSPTNAGERISEITLLSDRYLFNSDVGATKEPTQEIVVEEVKKEERKQINSSLPADIKEVYKYIKSHNGKVPNTKATKNIYWSELLKNDNSDNDIFNEISETIISNAYEVARNLQTILDTYFNGAKISITSGWRTKANNKSCRGSATSDHLRGLAIDFTGIRGYSTAQIKSTFKRVWKYGQIFTNYSSYPNLIHVAISKNKGFDR